MAPGRWYGPPLLQAMAWPPITSQAKACPPVTLCHNPPPTTWRPPLGRFVALCIISAADQCDQPGLWCKRTMGRWPIRPSAQCDNRGLAQVQTYYGPATDWHKCKRTIRPTDKRSLWETACPIRGAYMISAAYGSARNDKFCLYEYKCTTENENRSQ